MDEGLELLWQYTASALREGYLCKRFDPVQVVESHLNRCDQVNPFLNAMVAIDRDGARQAAKESLHRWKRGTPLGPLDGIPITVKDNLFVKNLRATWGSRLFSEYSPAEDDLAVAKLRAAGAIVLGKTNTPELALAGYTDNRLFGPTGNPWAPDLSPGGSSGGAAAAVMSGMAPLALTTDAAGSTRRPAGYVGCLGLKSSIGRISRKAGFPPLASDLQSIGLMARSVFDARTMLDVIANAAVGPKRDVNKPTLGAFLYLENTYVEPSVVKVWNDVREIYRAEGYTIVDVEPPYDPYEMSEIFVSLSAVGVARVVENISGWQSMVTEQIMTLAEQGFKTSATKYLKWLDRVAEFRAVFSNQFEKVDVFLTPTSPNLLWPKTEPYPKHIGGHAAGPRAAAIYTTFVNLAGLAGISVPAGQVDHNPIGMQFVGPPGSEELLLSVAQVLESARPWSPTATC